MDKIVKLPYGESAIPFKLPDGITSYVLSGQHAPGLKDAAGAIRDALKKPIGSPALADCLKKTDNVAVLTTDNTRHCPDKTILPPLLAELEKKVPRENISIIVALGLHAPLSRDEMIKKLGGDIAKNYRVLNHDPQRTTCLGKTSFGTPVEVNTEVIEADFRISTGFIEPHFFAGFSGGRKSICPGTSSARAIHHNHSFEMVEHPRARTGILSGNPIHEDMLEHARMARLDFIVNVLLNGEKRITRVFAGSPRLAHEKGCEMERTICRAELPRPADICIVTNGGAPLDLDFYQTCKGIDTAAGITRSGGIIIAVAACPYGIGPESFLSLHAAAHSPKEAMELARQAGHTGVAWQNQILARAQMSHTVYLLSGLSNSLAERMMVTPIPSIEEGLNQAFEVLGKDVTLAVIPEGPLVIPEIKTAR